MPRLVTLTVAASLLLGGAASALAQDTPELEARVERQLGVQLPLPERPMLANGRLIWKDYALSDLCAEFGGTFSKIVGKAIYQCSHPSFADITASVAGE